MPELYNISDWNFLPWFSTGGTRSKMYVQSPEGFFYFFKESEKREGKYYKYEFWSEIIAYELGILFGLNMLKYDIAIHQDIVGCISQSMHDPDDEVLMEGGKYLQSINDSFSPEEKQSRKLYTFQLIDKTLQSYGLDYIDKIIEVIIFDAVIGNGDRHQENWAFISKYSFLGKGITEIEKTIKENKVDEKPKLLRWLINSFYKAKDKNDIKEEFKLYKEVQTKPFSFAPIYDSGSSLGRELTDEKVLSMLKNKPELDAYIKRGTSEIRWDGEDRKLKHFDLVQRLLESSYYEIVTDKIKQFESSFNGAKLKMNLKEIDNLMPENFEQYKIPQKRKELILTLITLRLKKVTDLIK